MNEANDTIDPARKHLRHLVDTINQELQKGPGSTLLTSWNELTKQLALGPEPLVRRCPVCHHVGMREATLCSFCWTKLAVLPRTSA